MDETAMLESAQRGDARSCAALYDRVAPEVNRLVWRLLGADQDHRDLVQQVFCNVFEGLGAVRSSDRLRPWVRTVTVNTVRSELRRRKVRRFWGFLSDRQDEHAGSSTSPDDRQLLAKVYATLETLDTAEHIAFVLHYVEENSLAEVAQLTGASTSTVKRRLARAREAVERATGVEFPARGEP
jgi:RNA polymerase sigma-70 factor, ECF subfamily